MVGAGGLRDGFRSTLAFDRSARAATYLQAMVALTVLIDRRSRRIMLRRQQC